MAEAEPDSQPGPSGTGDTPAELDPTLIEYIKTLHAACEVFLAERSKNACPVLNVNEYECVRKMGLGVFGYVYLGRKGDEHVAIKHSLKAEMKKYGDLSWAAQEKQNSFAFDSPFCTKILGKFKDKVAIYLIMEAAMEYGDVEQVQPRYADAKFPEDKARQVMIQVVLGLEYLHAINVIHDAVERRNILIFRNGRVKLCDFHVSQYCTDSLFTDGGSLTPERWKAKLLDDAVDWYSLGRSLDEMLRPHEPDDPQSRRKKKRRSSLPTIISKHGRKFVKHLKDENPVERLGSRYDGANEVKSHKWFTGVAWPTDKVQPGELLFDFEGLGEAIPADFAPCDQYPFKGNEPDDGTDEFAAF